MSSTARVIAAAAVAVGVFVGPAVVAANALDLGNETVNVHIDNNHLTSICVSLHVVSRSHGNIIGPTPVCTP
jgi:hypothetical protein